MSLFKVFVYRRAVFGRPTTSARSEPRRHLRHYPSIFEFDPGRLCGRPTTFEAGFGAFANTVAARGVFVEQRRLLRGRKALHRVTERLEDFAERDVQPRRR